MASLKFAYVVVVMCMVVVSAPMAHAAISCGLVASAFVPCISYFRTPRTPPPACCSGLRILNNAANTTVDRLTACNCLKFGFANIPGINLSEAGSLQGICGVGLPFTISSSNNCTTIG